MDGVGNNCSNSRARADWHRRPKRLSASKKTKDRILKYVGLVGIVFAMPCWVVGTSSHVTGGAIHFAGMAYSEGLGASCLAR